MLKGDAEGHLRATSEPWHHLLLVASPSPQIQAVSYLSISQVISFLSAASMWYVHSLSAQFTARIARTHVPQACKQHQGKLLHSDSTISGFFSSLPNPSGIPHRSNASKNRSQEPGHLFARGGGGWGAFYETWPGHFTSISG